MTARVRNLILILAGMAGALVVFDYMTGGEWVQFVGALMAGLL